MAIVVLLLASLLSVLPAGPVSVAGEDTELEQLRSELNETKDQLARVERQRDLYAQRLEDSTMIIIITLILLIISYVIFFMSSKRQRVVLEQLRAETGVTLESPTQKRRPRRRRG